MWWLIGGVFLAGLLGAASRRPVVNNYNETYVDAECEGGGGDCDDGYDGGSPDGGSND